MNLIDKYENEAIARLAYGKDVHVALYNTPLSISVGLFIEAKQSGDLATQTRQFKFTYRLNGDRITRLAADLILRAYHLVEETNAP